MLEWNNSKRDRLVNSACIAILVFITVMAFIFWATAQNMVTSEPAQQLMMKNLLAMVMVAEFVVIVTLLYRIMQKKKPM